MSKGRFTALLAIILAAAIILKPPQEKIVYVAQNETGCTQYAEETVPQEFEIENENEIDGETAAVIAIIIIIIIILLFGGSETESS